MEGQKISIFDLGSRDGVWVELFYRNPVMLEPDSFFMLNDKYGLKVESFKEADATHPYKEENADTFLTLILVQKHPHFFFEQSKMVLGCSSASHYEFNFKK